MSSFLIVLYTATDFSFFKKNLPLGQLLSLTTIMLFGASWAERDWRDNMSWTK